MNKEQKKSIIEALLFVSDEPLTEKKISGVFEEGEVPEKEAKAIIEELNQDFANSKRSFSIVNVAGGYQIKTLPEFLPWLTKLITTQKKERLSKPALETLAIIAYRQPIIRADIEVIRGVDVGGMLGSLLDKNLIKIVGRKDIPGRPFIYETTQLFLEYFGLGSLKDLPDREKFELQMRAKQKLEEKRIELEMLEKKRREEKNSEQTELFPEEEESL